MAVLIALIMALASAIIWQIYAKTMFTLMAVANGHRLPGPTFVRDSESYCRATLAVFILFFSTLWAIKFSFLIFFKRLGENVKGQRILWWPIFGFTLATYFASIGVIQYHCLIASLETVNDVCIRNSSVNFQQTGIKLNCAWDVITDFLS